jgi:enoyl-CoA hydratase/carnithine racemase
MSEPAERRVVVRLDQREGGASIAHVIVNNAGKLNTLNTPLMDDFIAAFRGLAEDSALRAVVLTGDGHKAFVGGADIDEMTALDAGSARAFITRVHCCCRALRESPVPVIARIQGYALGAGLEIAAACDLRVAADTARLGMPEVKLGIPSVVEAALLPTLAGWGRAREMLLLGETFSARDAESWGLIERVVPMAELDGVVERWIQSILQAGPHAVRLQKKLIRAWENLPLNAAIEAGVDTFCEAWDTSEPRDMLKKFQASRRMKTF